MASGIALAALSAVVPASASTRAAPVVTVVAHGLNEPRHLTYGPGGLYVADGGTGGTSCTKVDGASYCEGETGSVVLVGPSGVKTVLAGLPSAIDPDEGPVGAAAVTFDRGRLAVLFQDTAVNPDGTTSVRGPGAGLLGKLLLAVPFAGQAGWSAGPDIAAFAAAHPQDPATLGGPPGQENGYDSDPYDIVPYAGGYAIADGAANDVLWLSPSGRLSVLDRLPTEPETVPAGVLGPNPVTVDAQAVPDSLAVGPDGALYVSSLPGFPALPGTSRIYRLVPGHQPAVVVTGLTEATGIAFDRQGRLLVTEIDTAGGLSSGSARGALLRVSRTGQVSTLPVTGLSQPTSVAVGPDGSVYVDINGDSSTAGSGEVLKITGLG